MIVPFIADYVPAWAHRKQLRLQLDKLARIFYRLWTSGEGYIDPGADYYEQRYRECMVKSLEKKAQALGMELVARPSREMVS